MNRNRKLTKVTVCAVAAAMMLTGSSFHTDATSTVASFLPAAGLGLTLGEGTSIAVIREDVKKRKAALKEKEETKSSETETAFSIEETEETTEEETVSESGTESSEETADTKESTETAESGGTETGGPVRETETEAAGETESRKETESESETESPSESPAETESPKESEAETGSETQKETESESRTGESSEKETETENETEIVEAIEPVIREPETKVSEEEQEEKKEEETLIIAQVNDYVNIRNTPGTDGEIVGKLYDDSVGTLIEEAADGWYRVKSGSVEGYVKAEYFKTGDEAKRIADEVGNKIAVVNTQTLKVRTDASLDASVLGLIPMGEELTVLEEKNGFVKVSIEEGDGWVSKDYVDVEIEYVTAESIEEERARLEEEEQAREEARKAAKAAEEKLRQEEQKRQEQEAAAQEDSGAQQEEAAPEQEEEQKKETVSAPKVSSDGSLGSAVASYATQFVGNPYVYGGTSLTNGADCSGFVMSVYKNFGVSLPHSSSADRHVGYAVGSLAEAQPGDLVCYSGHVGIYIGGGQIVHASTAATGIKISNADYRNPVAIRRIF